ncbi:hypothetical protein O0I10_012563 [Lichtheimia ornata]|uniref:Uncharacterized protein n=1 Tax=Lichtheimia ornata TaxID=688661 RepID=A0AAD7USW4_9FUNG|nr:uncharacterized protein O0I10_012563 [Lichtheimia ornata]KAJ8651870.1 hypothetical protein O0I10_012563 [Lichtheimia ornata]
MACPQCQKFNIAQRGYNPLRTISAEMPGDHWALDLANYETSSSGNKNLLVLVDMCTRFWILRPIPNKEAETIVKTLVQVFCDFGLPRIIQSDNGKEFVNNLMKPFARASGFEHRLVVPYHRKANGTAERWVQKATLSIKKMLNGATFEWDHYVPAVQLALNANVTSPHKTPPFTLVFARKVNDFKDYRDEAEAKPMTEEMLKKRIDEMRDIVFPAIHERVKTVTKQQELRFNKTHKIVEYKIGNFVMAREPESNDKFNPTYKGPYKIINKTETSYVLQDYEGCVLPRNYAPEHLKLVRVLEDIPADEIYELENIVDHKVHKGNFLYRVRWLDYTEDDTWEPPENFGDPVTITKYWKRIRSDPQQVLTQHRKKSGHKRVA